MAPAEDAAAPVGRRGGRQFWAIVLCFGSRRAARGEEALAGTSSPSLRRRKRTVPVDGEVVARTADREARCGADEEEARKEPRIQSCCFAPLARAHGRKHSTMGGGGGGGGSHHKQRQPEQTAQQQPRSRDETPSARLFQATAAAGNGNRSRRAAQPRVAPTETRPPTPTPTPTPRGTAHEDEASARESRTKESASGGGHGEKAFMGAFGPAVGLSVVAGVSMAGLLGGRLWAVACVCAWLVALSRRQRPEAPIAAGGDTAGSDGERVVVDVDSRDHKKLVVLSGLLERDRTKKKVMTA